MTQEATGKTVEEAIDLALMALGAKRDEVEVEVLSQGKPGFLGIGSEQARVRVRRITEEQRSAHLAMEMVSKMLQAMGAKTTATLRSAHDSQTGGPVIDIQGEDSGLLIGRRGETMRAMQFLVNLMVNHKVEKDKQVRVVLDVEAYRSRREKSLRELALRVAERVAATGRTIPLEPMSPAERRVIHMTLADHPKVTTESVGSGDNRKVTIVPKRRS
jgi:spoIIIJ-associated protein